MAFSGGSCLAFAVTPTTATTAVASSSSSSSSSSATTRRLGPNGPWVHGLYGTHLPVPHGGLELSYTVACTGSSRVALLLHFAREGQEGAGAAAAGAGAEAACGVAVGPWTAGDRATVEALRAAGEVHGVGGDHVGKEGASDVLSCLSQRQWILVTQPYARANYVNYDATGQ